MNYISRSRSAPPAHRLTVPRAPRAPSQARRPPRAPRAVSHDIAQVLIDQSYYIGKATILFVGFYTSLNWLYYVTLRKKMEDKENKKEK